MSKSKKSTSKPRPTNARVRHFATHKSSSSNAALPGVPHRLRDGTKLATVLEMLRRPKGVTIAEVGKSTGWQHHSVRGLISGTIKKKLNLTLTSEQIDGNRRYRIVEA